MREGWIKRVSGGRVNREGEWWKGGLRGCVSEGWIERVSGGRVD